MMTIGEARNAYYQQYKKFSQAAHEKHVLKEEAEKNARLFPLEADKYNEEAATLELSFNKLDKKAKEYLDYQSKIIEMECAYVNMESAKRQGEAMAESGAEEMKIMETARRIMRGDIVPPQDEEKLMKFNFKLYMAAKNMAIMAKEHEKDDSLWDDEESPSEELEDPIEMADSQPAPEGGPSLELEVSDVNVE